MEGGLEKWKNRYRGMRGWPLPGRAQAHRWSPLLPPQFFRVGLRTLLSTTTTTPNPQKGIPFSKKAGIPEAHSKGTTIPGIWNPTLYGIAPYGVRGPSAFIWNYGVAPGISQNKEQSGGGRLRPLSTGVFRPQAPCTAPNLPLNFDTRYIYFHKKATSSALQYEGSEK